MQVSYTLIPILYIYLSELTINLTLFLHLVYINASYIALKYRGPTY